jgi:hypothetical protein
LCPCSIPDAPWIQRNVSVPKQRGQMKVQARRAMSPAVGTVVQSDHWRPVDAYLKQPGTVRPVELDPFGDLRAEVLGRCLDPVEYPAASIPGAPDLYVGIQFAHRLRSSASVFDDCAERIVTMRRLDGTVCRGRSPRRPSVGFSGSSLARRTDWRTTVFSALTTVWTSRAYSRSAMA